MTTWFIPILRRLVPDGLNNAVKRSRLYVKHRSTYVNVYHCWLPKTGSQWIKAMLADSRTCRYSGLVTYTYQTRLPGRYDPRKLTERVFSEPFPCHTFVTPLYMDFRGFASIPRPEQYRAFFVMRDPRDLVVSSYFSLKYSHSPMGEIPQVRELLNSISLTDGMLHIIKRLQDRGHYVALRSWVDLSERDENVLLLRFEDLIDSDNLDSFRRLFSHCDIRMPEDVLLQLLQDYSFERLSGRKQGEEDKSAHYRKGIPGDWKNFSDDTIIAEFSEITGDLVVHLGYEKDLNW